MEPMGALAQAFGVAYAAGINVPATVAVLGIAQREGWIGQLPAGLDVVANPWIIGVAVAVYAFEFLVTLLPIFASVWETLQSLVRPPAAAILAAATVYSLDPVLVIPAALLGGGLGAATHGTKLGLRYAVDASPEPVTNAVANVAELGTIVWIAVMIWNHPYVTLGLAVALLVVLVLLVRRIVRSLRRLLSGEWYRAAAAPTRRD